MTDHSTPSGPDSPTPPQGSSSDVAQADRDAPQPEPVTRLKPKLTWGVIGMLLGGLVVWSTAVKDLLNIGLHINGSVISQDELATKYVTKDTYTRAQDDLETERKDATKLRERLTETKNELDRAYDRLRDEQQRTQAQTLACNQLASNISSLQDQQTGLEKVIEFGHLPGNPGSLSSEEKDDKRRHSALLQQQILEATRYFTSTCTMTARLGQP